MAQHQDAAAVAKKLMENLQTDLRTLSSECKRKYPSVKEVRNSTELYNTYYIQNMYI